mgnify:FL=1
MLLGKNRVMGWLETILCLLVTYILAGIVHPVCSTTSLFFSAILLYYIHTTGSSSSRPAP